MKIIKFIIISIIGIISSFSKTNDIDIQEKCLDNGLKVIVVNLKSNGVIFGGVGYYVGSGDDPRNIVGVSHILEHMMFKGTRNLSGDDLKKIIFVNNKFSNAFTSHDITFFVHLFSKDIIDNNLKIEADRMQNLKLDSSDLAKEKEVVIEERKMRTESDPRTNFMEEAAWKSMYLFSNYSYPVIGYLDQIRSCDQKVVRQHYRKYYKPNNAFVLLVGDITINEAVEKVKKYFGNIKRGEEHKRERVIDPIDTGLKHMIEHESTQISTHDLNFIYKIDRKYFDSVKKLAILEIVGSILASGESSILYQEIVDKNKISYAIDSYLDIRAFDKGRINISTVFRENQKKDIVESQVLSVIYDYVSKYLTKELFETEKKKLLDQIEILKDNPQNMGMMILTYLINGYNLEEVRNIKSLIKSIEFEDIKSIAEKIFTKDNLILKIYSHPKES